MATWLHELIESQPGDAPAVWDHDGTRIGYGALREAARSLAQELQARGVRGGDRVMLVAENCAAYVAATMAASRLAAWIMPVNARHTGAELRALRDHARPRVMLFTTGVSAEADAHAADFAATGRIETGIGALAATDAAEVPAEPVPDTPQARTAALMYTTGTTSAPKGVMLSHGSLCWNARIAARLRGIRPDDLVLGVLPGSHIFGFCSTMFATFHAGACIRFQTRFNPESVLDALAEGVGVWPAVPAMHARLVEYLDASGRDLVAPALHYISAGGAPLDPELKARVEARYGLTLNNGYGITEAAPTVAATRVDRPRSDVSVGPAVWDVTLSIDDPDAQGIGEIIVEGPGVMLGYYRNPEATAQALPRPGVLRTGDLGRLDPDGTLWIEGRRKELIIRSGFNVYPPEIEAMLTRHPAVSQAAVVGRPNDGDEEILAFLRASPGTTAAAIGDWLSTRLVAYKRPKAIFIVDDWPAAPTGKVLKHKLIDHFAAEIAAWEAQGIET